MEYIFLVVAAAWSLQFLLAYWQLRNFHRQLAQFRKLGRCSVGLDGNRWRGRTYGVLVLDPANQVRHAAVFSGWTIFSAIKPLNGVDGLSLASILHTATPPANITPRQWHALQHAAQFFQTTQPTVQPPSPAPPF